MGSDRQPLRDALVRRVRGVGSSAWRILIEKRRFIGSSLSRASSVIVQTLLAFTISHLFGLAALGNYYLITAWALMFGTVLSFGTSEYLMREVSQLDAAGQSNAAKATVLHAVAVASLPCLAFAAVLSLNPELSSRLLLGSAGSRAFVLYLGPVALALALRRIVAHVLKGRGKPELGFLIEYSLPTCIVLAILLTYYFAVGSTISADRIFAIALVGEVSGLAIGTVLAFVRWRGTDRFKSHYHLGRSLQLGLAVIMQALFLNIAFLILPRYVGAEDIGTFGICMRVAGVAMVFLEAVIGVYAPGFSVLMAQGKLGELKEHYARARGNLWISSIPILLLVMLTGGPILQLFNANREGAWLVLVLLTLARFSEAVLGPVSFFMWMIRRETVDAAATFFGIVIAVSSVLFIGPLNGLKVVTSFYALGYFCRVCIDWLYISRTVFAGVPAKPAGE